MNPQPPHNRSTALAAADNPSATDLTQLSQRSALEAIRENLTARVVRTESGVTKFRPGASPTAAERGAALQAISRMRRSLAPSASSDDVHKALRRLGGGLKPRRDEDVVAMRDTFVVALAGVSAAALDMAVVELVNGTTAPDGPRYDKVFMPSSAELATLCRTIRDRWTLRIDNVEMMLDYPEAVRAVELSARERQKNQERIAGLLRRPQEAPDA